MPTRPTVSPAQLEARKALLKTEAARCGPWGPLAAEWKMETQGIPLDAKLAEELMIREDASFPIRPPTDPAESLVASLALQVGTLCSPFAGVKANQKTSPVVVNCARVHVVKTFEVLDLKNHSNLVVLVALKGSFCVKGTGDSKSWSSLPRSLEAQHVYAFRCQLEELVVLPDQRTDCQLLFFQFYELADVQEAFRPPPPPPAAAIASASATGDKSSKSKFAILANLVKDKRDKVQVPKDNQYWHQNSDAQAVLDRYQDTEKLRKAVLPKAMALGKEFGCSPRLLALVSFMAHAMPEEFELKEDLIAKLAQDLKDPETALLVFMNMVPVFRIEADVLVKALIEEWNKWAKEVVLTMMNNKPGLVESVYDKHPEFKAVLRPSIKTREDKILLVFYLTMTDWLANSAVVPSSITENRCAESLKKLGFPGNLALACAEYFVNVQLSFYPAPAVPAAGSQDDDLMGMLEVSKPSVVVDTEMDDMLTPIKKKSTKKSEPPAIPKKKSKKTKPNAKTAGKRKAVDEDPQEDEEEEEGDEEEEEEEEEGDEEEEEEEEGDDEDMGFGDMEDDLKFHEMKTEKKVKIAEPEFVVPSGDFKTWNSRDQQRFIQQADTQEEQLALVKQMVDITGKTFIYPNGPTVDPLHHPHAGSTVHVVTTKVPISWAETNCPAKGLSEAEKKQALDMCKLFLEAEEKMGYEYGLENKFVYRQSSGPTEHLAMFRESQDGLVARASPMVIYRKKNNNTMTSGFHYVAYGERGTELDDPRFLCNVYLLFAKPEAGARVQEFFDKIKSFTLNVRSFDI